jgi:indolepyruvate ferredoxin oxidoreductase alpha subunit
MYYGINLAIEELGLKPEDVIFASDIGCYTLGITPPYNAADYLLSMGSSVGDGCGFSVSTDQKVASFIGDSTFFHSGVSPLINAVHNKHNFVLTVLDNRITAMTGGQPNPGIPVDGMGDDAPEVSIRKLALACGCDYVRVINPFNLEQVIKTYKEAFERDDTAVIISKAPCTLIKGLAKKPPVNFKEGNCNYCDKCVNELACPAISKVNGKITIDKAQCDGCNVCIQVCKYGALEAGR